MPFCYGLRYSLLILPQCAIVNKMAAFSLHFVRIEGLVRLEQVSIVLSFYRAILRIVSSFHSENTSNVLHPHYSWEIWKRKCWLLLGVEDTGHVTVEHRLANLLFILLSSGSFVLSFCTVLQQLCLLHRVVASCLRHPWETMLMTWLSRRHVFDKCFPTTLKRIPRPPYSNSLDRRAVSKSSVHGSY